MTDQSQPIPNRRQRRVQQVLERKKVGRQTAARQDVQMSDVPDGVLVLMNTTIEHPVRGSIPIVVDEKMQESLERHSSMICGARRIPMAYSPPSALPRNDRAVQYYLNLSFAEDHAREMAARYWEAEDRAARNAAGMLVLFEYVDFPDSDVPDDPDWETEEYMARYSMPSRPFLNLLIRSERKLRFIKEMIRTGTVLSVADKAKLDAWLDTWEEHGTWVDDEGVEQTEEPTLPTFAVLFMQAMTEVAERTEALTAEGVVSTGEPVDEAGFPGKPVSGGLHSPDDSVREPTI